MVNMFKNLGEIMIEEYFKIIFSDTYSLDSKELRIQALGIFFIIFLLFVIPSLIIYNKSPLFAVSFALGGFVFAICGFLAIWLRDTLTHYFEMFYPNSNELSFEGILAYLLFVGIGSIFLGIIIGVMYRSLISCFCFFLAFSYPIFFMLIRRDIFKRDFARECLVYHPILYWFLGIVTGIILFGFSSILINYQINNGISYFCLIGILVSFIIESLILSPDLMNKVFPFEIRKISGFIAYSIFAVVLSIIFCLVMNYFIY